MAKKKYEEKLERLQNQNDSYFECFPEEAPELEELKARQKRALERAEKQKEKEAGRRKEGLTAQAQKVNKV